MLPTEPNKNHSQDDGKRASRGGFVCRRCGQCCREPGYVYLTDKDIDRISDYLDMDIATFTARYTRLPPERRGLSLVEREDQSCVFLDQAGRCAIQAVKPLQCERFPHDWRYQDMQSVCPGWGTKEEARVES